MRMPRRLRRGFDRIGAPPAAPPAAPPRQLLTVAVLLLVFATGVATGRRGMLPRLPADRISIAPIAAAPLGEVAFVTYARTPGPGQLALLRYDVRVGKLRLVQRMAPPSEPNPLPDRYSSQIQSFDGSVAVVLSTGKGKPVIAATAPGAPPLQWLEGLEAAWEARDSLLVLQPGGLVQRWRLSGVRRQEQVEGFWTSLSQTHSGVVLEGVEQGRHHIAVSSPDGPVKTIDLPEGAHLLAASPRGDRALVEVSGEAVMWDGKTLSPSRLSDHRPVSASFSPDGRQVAITLRGPGMGDDQPTSLAVLDHSGARVMLRVLPDDSTAGCHPAPSWHPGGGWLVAAGSGGSMHALEVGGGRVERLKTRVAGCGIAWAS